MSVEEELKQWLSQEDKTFEESVNFAIKAWKAVELTSSQKHEVILQWFSENVATAYEENAQNFNWDLIEEFLSLQYPPALINPEAKVAFLNAFQSLAQWHNSASDVKPTRRITEILNKILHCTITQGTLLANPKSFCKFLNALFTSYTCYLQRSCEFLQTYEGVFITEVLKSIKRLIDQSWNSDSFKKSFRKKTLTSLVEVVILLKFHKFNCFEELLQIEKVLFLTNDKDVISDEFLALPAHVLLQNIECAIVHFRGHTPFLKSVLQLAFERLNELDQYTEPKMFLTTASNILNLFCKQNINVNFEFNKGSTAIQFLGKKIEDFVNLYYKDNLYDILMLLCSAMRLNPLILEKGVFEIMTKCLTARKTEKSWVAYQEFVILLIDMFRKLSRSEKFVHNLFTSVNKYLKENKISKKLKRKLKGDVETPMKKMKVDDSNYSIVSQLPMDEDNEENIFLKMFSDQFKDSKLLFPTENLERNTSWSHVYYAWPPSTVGVAFSNFVSNLMTKPSMVIWKTLIFLFIDTLNVLETTAQLDDNILFLIDLNAALLCQYLSGSRIAEHSDKFWKDIEDNRTSTCKLLTKFCDILLKFEYNNRMMNAFLEICYHIGVFDMIRWNYCPDSINPESVDIPTKAKGIHDYLSKDKWTLIEQRIINFGKTDCKVGINRLRLERLKACELILKKQEKPIDIQKIVLSSSLTDTDLIKAIFSNNDNLWIIKYLTKEQKLQICDLVLMNPSCRDSELLKNFTESHDFLELILINLFKYIAPCIPDKKSVLASIDFDELLISSQEDRIQLVAQAIKGSKNMQHIKTCVVEDIKTFLDIAVQMPIEYCKSPTKTVMFSLSLALCKDLIAANNKELVTVCYNLLTDLLHIGEPIRTFHYFEVDVFFSILPLSTYPEFYEILFKKLRWMGEDGEICMKRILDILKSNQQNFNDDQIKLCTTLNDALQITSPSSLKKYHADIFEFCSDHIKKFFAEEDRDLVKDKVFVEKTLQIYTMYLNWVLGNVARKEEIDDKFRRVCKIYIGHSMDGRNSYAMKLIDSALKYCRALHFDTDEIDFVLQKYWDQMLSDIQMEGEVNKNVESVVKLVVTYKSNEEFAKILSALEKDLRNGRYDWIIEVLLYVSKSIPNSQKGVIFNSYFKNITFLIMMKLEKDSNGRYKDLNLCLKLLEAQIAYCENKKMPMSLDLMDDILCFLIDLSIRKFILTDTNVELFYNLHQHMTAVCTALMKCRHLFLTDRIPQLVYIIKDLIQAICWYKCDRQKDDSLDKKELEKLAELSQKLEALMHIVTSHAIEVKRLAPYLLTFIINLMVTNTRPTTLYPTIKTPIESICYDLISVCDHRVKGFILRCSNDAMKQVYETLCKEYQKYHKFKGKV